MKPDSMVRSPPLPSLEQRFEPTITWVPSGFPGYIWLDTKIVFLKKQLRGLGSTVSSPSGVWGEAPAANDFGAFYTEK